MVRALRFSLIIESGLTMYRESNFQHTSSAHLLREVERWAMWELAVSRRLLLVSLLALCIYLVDIVRKIASHTALSTSTKPHDNWCVLQLLIGSSRLALLASVVLAGSSIPRAIKTQKPLPAGLSLLALYGLYTFGTAFRARKWKGCAMQRKTVKGVEGFQGVRILCTR
jgi:hypothetical protein